MPPKYARRYPYKKKNTKKYQSTKQNYKMTVYGKKGNKNFFRAGPSYGVKAQPFPQRLFTKVQYARKVRLQSDTTIDRIGNEYVFRLNSIWDPQYSLGGTTVMGWAQFNNLYQKYLVHGIKVQINLTNPTLDGLRAVYTWNQDDTVDATLVGKDVGVATLHPKTASVDMNNTGSQRASRSLYLTPWSLEGLSKLEFLANKTDRASAMNDNPSNDMLLRIALANMSTTTGATVECEIKITYFTEFYDRHILATSSF